MCRRYRCGHQGETFRWDSRGPSGPIVVPSRRWGVQNVRTLREDSNFKCKECQDFAKWKEAFFGAYTTIVFSLFYLLTRYNLDNYSYSTRCWRAHCEHKHDSQCNKCFVKELVDFFGEYAVLSLSYVLMRCFLDEYMYRD